MPVCSPFTVGIRMNALRFRTCPQSPLRSLRATVTAAVVYSLVVVTHVAPLHYSYIRVPDLPR